MGTIAEIKQMINERLAFKLSLKKEEFDLLLFSDKRYLLFVRLMGLFGVGFPLAMLYLIHHKTKEVPLPVDLILCFFTLAFLIMLLVKLFTHKELLLDKTTKKISLFKKSFSKILKETNFDFNQVKHIKIEKVLRRERVDNDSNRTRINTYLEINMELKSNETIYFSSINDSEKALELASKIASFVEAPLKNKR